jgi:nucleoid DNA-binding protein
VKGDFKMTRADFVKEISTKMNCTRDDAKKMIEAVEEVTLAAIKAEDDVPFSFAKIGGKTKPARMVRNPKTGEQFLNPEKTGQPYAKFKKAAKE